MNNTEIEKTLLESLEDFKLDQNERIKLTQLSESLRSDQINFLRNKSFELTRHSIESDGAEAFRIINWLERVVKIIQPEKQSHLTDSSAWFSPGDDCRNKITRLMRKTRNTINICVFTISDNKITESILQAHKRGIKITIISDNDKANDRGSDIDYLSNKGVKVLLDDSPNHMHHKFAIFDNRILLSGSFNWTRSASEVNEENIIVTADQKLVTAFNKKFGQLKTRFARY